MGRTIIALDMGELRTLGREVESLKATIDGYEQEMKEMRAAHVPAVVNAA